MPKIQAVTAMTLNGFLPDAADMSMRWVMNHRKGFAHWRERCDARILPHSILDLLCEKDSKDNTFTYLAEIILNRWNCSGDFSFTTSLTNWSFTCFPFPPEGELPYNTFFLLCNGGCMKPLIFPTASAD